MINFSFRNFFYGFCPNFLRPYWHQIEGSAIGGRLARSIFWALAGGIISRGLMLLATILLAQILGRESYGEYGIIRSTLQMFLVFAGFGLGLTATKHVAEYRIVNPLRAGRIMALSGLFATVTGAIIALAMIIFAPWLAAKTINAPHLTNELRTGAIVLFLSAINGAQTGALACFEAFKTIAKVNLSVGIISFPILLFGAYFGGLNGAIWALAGNMAVSWILNHLALRNESARFKVPFAVKECWREWPILWKFSFPAALSGLMISPVVWASNAILVNQQDGYGQMGLFDAANQWRMAILFVPSVVGQIVLPMLSNFNGQSDRIKFRKTLKYNAIINSGTAFAAALPIALFAKFIMGWYGTDFKEGSWVLAIMSFTTILVSLNSCVGQAIASQGKMWIGFLFNGLWGISLLTSSWIFIRQGYGALGLALANFIAYTLHSAWQSFYILRILKK
jgi:O-antigen/teichoic acid export membrane protein